MNTITKTTKTIPTIAIEVEATAQTVTATFKNGEQLIVDCSKFSDELKTMAMLHGVKQKIGDAAAIARNTDTGASATVEDKYNAMSEVVERLNSNGDWNKVRDGGAGNSSKYSQLVLALMEHSKRDKAAIDVFLAGKSKEQITALRVNPSIAAIIARFANEASARKGVDSESLLDELI